MTQQLHDIVGLPSMAPSTDVANAADLHFDELLRRISGGDYSAQHALVELQCAYLVWAYAGSANQRAASYVPQTGD
jgi:hypothetical protein